jgi:hypothetical protein
MASRRKPRSIYFNDLPRHDLADRIVPVHEAQLANGGLEGSLTKLVLFLG